MFTRRMKQMLAAAAIISWAALFPLGSVNAATTTSTFTVNATITNSCTVTNSGDINLTQVTTSGSNTVSITCNIGTGWTVAFGGANDAAGQAILPFHYMKDTGAGSSFIEYILTGSGSGWTFSDSQSRLANDGNNPPTSFKASGTGTGLAQTATITATATTGAVPFSITTAATGAYTDTVTVTVFF